MTEFQIKYFLVGKEPTHQAKLKRIIDEVKGKAREQENIRDELDELTDRIKLLELEFIEDDGEIGEIKNRMHGRKVVALNRKITELESILKCKEEEIDILAGIYDELTVVQPLLDWDSEKVQLEYWETKLKNEVALRLQLNAPQEMETIKTVKSLPHNSTLKLSNANK